jgi:hypothetical protein
MYDIPIFHIPPSATATIPYTQSIASDIDHSGLQVDPVRENQRPIGTNEVFNKNWTVNIRLDTFLSLCPPHHPAFRL